VKVATFTVRGTAQQALRWNRASQAEGYASAGAWMADAVDRYLQARVRAGRPIPLAWSRGRFAVRFQGEEVKVSGMISPPFASTSGTEEGPACYAGRRRHVLVFMPDARIIATLRSYRQCQALASELAPILLRGDLPSPPGGIIERHRREAV
jgi:hypothetical protein